MCPSTGKTGTIVSVILWCVQLPQHGRMARSWSRKKDGAWAEKGQLPVKTDRCGQKFWGTVCVHYPKLFQATFSQTSAQKPLSSLTKITWANSEQVSRLIFDETNWLFVFAALLQVIGGGGLMGFLLEGANVECDCTQKNASSVISPALWFSRSLFWSGQWFCMQNALCFHNFQSILVWSCAKTQKALHALPARALLFASKAWKLAALDLLSFAYHSAIVHYRSPIVCNRSLSFAYCSLSFTYRSLSFTYRFAIVHLSFTGRSPIVRQSFTIVHQIPRFCSPCSSLQFPFQLFLPFVFQPRPKILIFWKTPQKPTDTTPELQLALHTPFSDQPVR